MRKQIYAPDYETSFSLKKEPRSKHEAALDRAECIRRFEIDLYWRRTTYFWTLITIAFAGFFALIQLEDEPEKFLYSCIITVIGFILSLSWHLVNRGSKYWQENWENHIELLEDQITGPLYKTVLERPGTVDPKKSFSWHDRWIHGPRKFSVSKINAIVSFFVTTIWAILIFFTLAKFFCHYFCCTSEILDMALLFVSVILAAATVWLLVCKARTHTGDHGPLAFQRKTYIRDYIE